MRKFMNKLILPAIIILILQTLTLNGSSLDSTLRGKPSLRVFSNFKKGILEDDRSSAFEVKRVYLGYSGNISENFSAEVKLDIGSPEDLSQYSLIRRYAYFKTAGLYYKNGRINAYFGLFDMMQFKTQELFWGYRYIAKSFQDEYKFGSSADFGAGLKFKITDYLETDLVISNGEGYNNLQADNSYNTGIGLTFKSKNGLIIRSYYDFIRKETIQRDIVLFAGYQHTHFRVAGEYNQKYNSSFFPDHHLKGLSFYSTIILNENWEIFARYDLLKSNILFEETKPWNLIKDGSSIISGVQYKPVKGIAMSVNYQDWVSSAINGKDKAFLYFSLQFEL